jgi:hypothetical protein
MSVSKGEQNQKGFSPIYFLTKVECFFLDSYSELLYLPFHLPNVKSNNDQQSPYCRKNSKWLV